MTSSDTSSSRPDHRLAELAAAAVGDEEARPVWVWSGNGNSLIWANSAGLDVFGVHSQEAADALDITPTKPASRSLVAIARTPVGAGGRGRVEILRIATAHHQETLVATCKPIALGDDIAVIAVASGSTRAARAVPVEPLRPLKTDLEPTDVSTEPPLSVAEPPELESHVPAEDKDVQSPDFNLSVAENISEPDDQITDQSLPTFVFKPRSRPHRFSFLVNQEGRIRALSSGLADAVGETNSLQDGDVASEALERLAHDIEPAVRNALAERRRFSEHSVMWPVSDHMMDVPVRLSGFDEDDGELRVFGTVLTGKAQERSETASDLEPLALNTVLSDDVARTAGLFTDALNTPPEPPVSETIPPEPETVNEPVPLTVQAPGGAALAAAAGAIAAGIAKAMRGPVSHRESIDETVPDAAAPPITDLDEQLGDDAARIAGLWTDEAALPQAGGSAETTFIETADPITALDDELTSEEAEFAGLWASDPPAIATSTDTTKPSTDADDDGVPESTRKAMAAVAAGLAAGLAAGPIRRPSVDPSANGQDEPPVFVPTDAPVLPEEGLSRPERLTFQEIARRLGARITEQDDDGGLADDDGSQASSTSADVVELDRSEEDSVADRSADDTAPIEDDTTEPPAGGQVLAFTCTEPNAERMVLDRLPLGVIIYHESSILYANRAALEISGRPSLDALQNAHGVENLFAQGGDELGQDDGSMVLVRPDGSKVSVAGRLQSVRWDGQAAAMLSIREQSARQGEESEQANDAALTSAAAIATADALPLVRARIGELEAIVDLASDGVVTLNADGEIKDLNQAAQALVGYSADDLIGRPFRLLFAEDSRQQALDYLDDIAEQGHLSLFNEGREVECLTAQGGLVPVFMTVGRLTDDQPPAFCAVLRDLSPFKQAETDLVAARRAAEEASAHKSDFLARVSHEIRTPLNAVIGFSEVMLEERFGPVGSERYRQYLRDIHTSGEHLMSLLNDLLDLSKIEAGKMELSFGEVDLNDVVKQCLAIMQPQANQGRIIVRTSLPLSVPKVVADIRSIRQIVLNLMSNAIKFTDPGGQIIISTLYEPSGEVSLRVRDTGRGMDAADVELALEPFRQVPTTLNQVITGTGLGLPLTKALVEANRAQFGLDSTPGEGTLAKVTFPLQRVLAE